MASLEERIDALTAAVVKLTDLMAGGAALPAASGKDKPAAGKDKPAATRKPKITAAEVQAAIVEVKEKHGQERAREIIEEHGGSGTKLAKLVTMPDKFEAVMASCKEALEEEDAGDGDDDDI